MRGQATDYFAKKRIKIIHPKYPDPNFEGNLHSAQLLAQISKNRVIKGPVIQHKKREKL